MADDDWDVIARMLAAAASIVDSSLRRPRQGDSDEGTALRLDAPHRDQWASLLSLGTTLLEDPDWWPNTPAPTARSTAWATLTSRRLSAAPKVGRTGLFPDAGMVLLRAGMGPDEIWCRGDAGPHGFLRTAAHAHADALSVEVRLGGVDLLADPGTFVYHDSPEWRSYYRSTRGHNTLELAGVDQSVSAGSFMWSSQANSRLTRTGGLNESGGTGTWTGEHDGYERLDPPALHRRTVALDREARTLTIDDDVVSDGRHDVAMHYHLGPAVGCELDGSTAILTLDVADSPRTVVLALPSQLGWESVRGRTEGIAGWYSPAFGVSEPTTTLVGKGSSDSGPFVTSLNFDSQPPMKGQQ